MNEKETALLSAKAASGKKAFKITILYLEGLSIISDYFVICEGTSRVHVQAIADSVEEELRKQGVEVHRREGYPEGRWILLDFGSVIVHVFQGEERQFYNLERLWGDAPLLNYEDNPI